MRHLRSTNIHENLVCRLIIFLRRLSSAVVAIRTRGQLTQREDNRFSLFPKKLGCRRIVVKSFCCRKTSAQKRD